MTCIEISRQHRYSGDEATSRFKRMIDDLQSRAPRGAGEVRWSPDNRRVTVTSKHFEARLETTAAGVEVEVELLSLLARMAKGKLRREIENVLDKHFPVA